MAVCVWALNPCNELPDTHPCNLFNSHVLSSNVRCKFLGHSGPAYICHLLARSTMRWNLRRSTVQCALTGVILSDHLGSSRHRRLLTRTYNVAFSCNIANRSPRHALCPPWKEINSARTLRRRYSFWISWHVCPHLLGWKSFAPSPQASGSLFVE